MKIDEMNVVITGANGTLASFLLEYFSARVAFIVGTVRKLAETAKPKKNEFNIKNPKHLETVTRVLFSNRRKMINKNFLKLFNHDKSVAEELNLNLNQRPEELSSEMFYKIAMKYEELFG